MLNAETIFALSSGAPPAAVAIIRISGADALSAASALAGTLPPPRFAALRTLRDPDNGSVLDQALVISFPGPDNVTGEDLAELHVHGGRAVVRAVEAALEKMPELRRAEPGEFTRRAFIERADRLERSRRACGFVVCGNRMAAPYSDTHGRGCV